MISFYSSTVKLCFNDRNTPFLFKLKLQSDTHLVEKTRFEGEEKTF